MVFFRKHWLVFVMVGVGIALLAAALILRARIIDAAHADMQRRGIYWFQIVGTRIPCEGMFDVGVAVTLQEREEEKPRFGRLCHPLNWSGEWEWYPNEKR